MSTIGLLKTEMNGSHEELTGEIRTLQFSLNLRFMPVLDKTSIRAPDYKIYGGQWDDKAIRIGNAWKKTKIRTDGSTFEFISITIDDPSFPHALNVAAFKNYGGDWEITYRRRQSKPL